jgi:hypothetical protein
VGLDGFEPLHVKQRFTHNEYALNDNHGAELVGFKPTISVWFYLDSNQLFSGNLNGFRPDFELLIKKKEVAVFNS